MAQVDLQLGGGYIYQWECAILLAVNYFADNPYGYNSETNKLVIQFLGDVEAVHLEGRYLNSGDASSLALEDINLVNGLKAICIQIKTKEATNELWKPSDEAFRKALLKFYRNPALDDADPPARFVFLSNTPFGTKLTALRSAIATGTITTDDSVDDLFRQMQKYASTQPDQVILSRERFNRLLMNLSLDPFLALDTVKDATRARLQSWGLEDTESAYQCLFTEFSRLSVVKGGSRITFADIYKFLGYPFQGRVKDYITSKSLRSVADYLTERCEGISLPPIGYTVNGLLGKIEALLGAQRDLLNEIESFVLIAAVCTPFLLRQLSQTLDFQVQPSDLTDIANNIQQEPHAPQDLCQRIIDAATEITQIANARKGFAFSDSGQYSDTYIRDTPVRIRLLSALLHLAYRTNLDEHVDPVLPASLEQASWPEVAEWWRQAYVRSVRVDSGKLNLSFRLPTNKASEYEPLLVHTLDEEIYALVDSYDALFVANNISIAHRKAKVETGNVLEIPDNDWRRLRTEIETETAQRSREQLHLSSLEAQRQIDLLVRSDLRQAELMVAEGRSKDAAERYSRVASLLARAQETLQARLYYVRAAEQFLQVGDKRSGCHEYLQAADILAKHSLSPILASQELQQAAKLADELEAPDLQLAVLRINAILAFAELNVNDLSEIWKHCKSMVATCENSDHTIDQLIEFILQFTFLNMALGKWDIARDALAFGASHCPSLSISHGLRLRQAQLQLATEICDWDWADSCYTETLKLLTISGNSVAVGELQMHYAASLARRGALADAESLYDKVVDSLEITADIATIALAYRNRQYMLMRNGGMRSFLNVGHHESRRIDLYRKAQVTAVSEAHENAACSALVTQDYRSSLQHILLALAFQQRDGDWLGIERSYRFLARLRSATGDPIAALLAAIRGADTKQAETLATDLASISDANALEHISVKLITGNRAVCEQSVTAKALGVLADVIPPSQLKSVETFLRSVLEGPEENEEQVSLRRNSAESLEHLLPQLSVEQLNALVHTVLKQLERKQFWTVREKLLDLLGGCFIYLGGSANPTICRPAADILLKYAEDEHFSAVARRAAVNLARHAPTEIRTGIINYLHQHIDHPEYLRALVFLEESIDEQDIRTAIDTILEQINPKPETSLEGNQIVTKIGFSLTTPRALNILSSVIPDTMYSMVIDGLLEAVINEHNPLVIRSDAILALSELPQRMFQDRADEIFDYLLWGGEGTLPVSGLMSIGTDSESNPFSSIRLNLGSRDQVRRSSLRAIGRLYSFVNDVRRQHTEDALTSSARDTSDVVRTGVAMALGEIATKSFMPLRLLLTLAVLQHDLAAMPCAWACIATGKLVEHGLTDPVALDLIGGVLELSRNSSLHIDVRVGVAMALQSIVKANGINDEMSKRAKDSLANMAEDVNHRVRREVTLG